MPFEPKPRTGKALGEASRIEGWTKADLGRALEYLGWSGAELAKRIGTDRQQVSRWRRGKAKVSKPLEAYLKVMIRLADIVDGN